MKASDTTPVNPALPEMPEQPAASQRPLLTGNLRFFLLLLAMQLLLFAVLRAGLILRVRQPSDAAWGDLIHAFFVGLRFDLSTAVFLLGPVLLLCYVPGIAPWSGRWQRRFFLFGLTLAISILALICIAEFEFFAEFQTRFNQLAIRYIKDDAQTVGGMIWYNEPVIPYVLGWLLLAAIIHFSLRLIFRLAYPLPRTPAPRNMLMEAASGLVIATTIVFGARGGFQSEPLRWGDAFHGDNEFVSQMSLNGLWCLGQAFRETFGRGEQSGGWIAQMSTAEARDVTRKMILTKDEALLDASRRTVLRKGNVGSSLLLKPAAGAKPVNVVVVMMESFSARYCGATGSPRSFTPEFDKLAKDGILFDRAFSAGSHTHQGIFATLLGFPNLPGYESLMQSGAGNQEFLSIPEIFHARGHQTFFLYNGNFAWDNMRGFFKKQGVDTFIGGDEMLAEAKFRDHVWGVSDGDLFDRSNREFEAASKKGPFMAAIMTLSNHAPFEVPPVPGAAPITDMGENNRRLEAMRYADWCVGKFIEDAKKLTYFQNTLFVFVGDHGFTVRPKLTEVHLLYHHVPLLFYAPGLTDQHRVDHRVACQINIAPSILGLLGVQDAPQATWGRSLFNDNFPDENFAVFKMTGGGKAVAIVRGDDLLVINAPKTEPLLMTYSLSWPEPSVTLVTDAASATKKKDLARELKAYVQSALVDLTERKAGPGEK